MIFLHNKLGAAQLHSDITFCRPLAGQLLLCYSSIKFPKDEKNEDLDTVLTTNCNRLIDKDGAM